MNRQEINRLLTTPQGCCPRCGAGHPISVVNQNRHGRAESRACHRCGWTWVISSRLDRFLPTAKDVR